MGTCWRPFAKLALISLVCLQLLLSASVTRQGFPESTPKALQQHTYDNSAWCPSTHLSSSTQNDNIVNTTSICRSEDDNDEKDRGGGGCRPCRRRFLVIVATGRSASTTLTRMIDTLPGMRLSGENNDLMGQLYDLHNGTLKMLLKSHKKEGAWHRNKMSESSVACAVQSFVETITPPPALPPIDSSSEERRVEMDRDERQMIIGFKTIRLLKNHTDTLKGRFTLEEATGLVEYILRMLPCSRFLVNIRSETAEQAVSTQKAFVRSKIGLEQRKSVLDRKNEILRRIAEETLGPERAYFLDSSQWTKNVSVLNDALEWMGYTHPDCRFEELMEFNTAGGKGYGHNKTVLKPHGPGCVPL